MRPALSPSLLRCTSLAALLLCGAALAGTGRERSLAVYPAQGMPIRFDHAQHLDAGADCVACHDRARKSERAGDVNLPAHPECEDCHDIKGAQAGKKVDPPAACKTCHVGFDETAQKTPARVSFPAPNLLFPHKVHVDRKIECKTCHGAMDDVGLATRMQLPKMESCLVCHDGHFASDDCGACHMKAASGRLQQNFASGILRPTQGNPLGLDHGPRFEFTHGTRASINRASCMTCHADNFCLSCHDALQKPLSVHPNDYILLHPLQARIDSPRCEGCHRYQSFCASCHERVGVGMSAAAAFRPANVRIHPPYAVWVTTPGPQHHALAAARDIRQCISCHREESCLTCHSSSQLNPTSRGTNPHPAGFAKSCGSLFDKNPRSCLTCHVESGLRGRCQ